MLSNYISIASLQRRCRLVYPALTYTGVAFQACPLNPMPQTQDGLQQWEKFSECITPAISNVVSFAKSIPGFQVFGPEDQVTLLKVGNNNNNKSIYIAPWLQWLLYLSSLP